MDWKPERAIQAKVRDLQKIIQKMMMKTKTEASQFKWVEWKNALCAGFQMATSAKVVELMGCYPFDEWINGPYPISWFEYGLYPHQLVWKWIWIWVLPHRLVWIWVLPHMWLVWRALSPSVVRLTGFIPISGLFEGLYPDSVLVHLPRCYPQ